MNYRIALVGFSAGGILNGEVFLNWRDLANGTALDSSYRPDALDEVPVSACAVGMIYSFYGRLSMSMNDVETLILEGYPHGYGAASRPDVWGNRFDDFLTRVMSDSSAGINQINADVPNDTIQEIYDLQGRRTSSLSEASRGIYIVKDASGVRKILK